MKDVYKSTGVDSSKVTHHRSQAVQYAGSQGLTMEQVQTLTKHITNKLHISYQPEVEAECMKVMSGFKKVSFALERIVPNILTILFPGSRMSCALSKKNT